MVDGNSFGTVGNPVSVSQIEEIVQSHIDANFILTRDHAKQNIGTYGGVFLTGFKSQNLSTIVIKGGYQKTVSSNVFQVVNNVRSYLEDHEFFYQLPQEYDVLKVDPYITNSIYSVAETILYEKNHFSNYISIDPLINS